MRHSSLRSEPVRLFLQYLAVTPVLAVFGLFHAALDLLGLSAPWITGVTFGASMLAAIAVWHWTGTRLRPKPMVASPLTAASINIAPLTPITYTGALSLVCFTYVAASVSGDLVVSVDSDADQTVPRYAVCRA